MSLAALAATTDAQPGSVAGRVVDASTGAPLPGANVYLSQTTRGASTNADGAFVIDRVPPGTYDFVVSFVGYERIQQSLDIGGAAVEVSVRLRPRVEELDVAVVDAGLDLEWRRQLQRFEREFFGDTPQGRACEILNPEVIDFNEAAGVLTARASQPLVYINRALGYRVTYLLDRFRTSNAATEWGGASRFEDLDGSDRDRSRWQGARREAHRGSLRHFLQTLARGTTGAEGFEVYLMDDERAPQRLGFGSVYVPRVPPDSILAWTASGPALAFDRVLHVEYTRERRNRDAPEDLVDTRIRHQHSTLSLETSPLAFSAQGLFATPYLAQSAGYWGWEERVGNLLPLDYVPEGD